MALARYKVIVTRPRFIALDLQWQQLPATFEHALNHLFDHEVDLSARDARYRNDETGASAYPPATLLKLVLFAYSQGVVSSRGIEALCREHAAFIALSVDSEHKQTNHHDREPSSSRSPANTARPDGHRGEGSSR